MRTDPVSFRWITVDVTDEKTGVVESVLAMVPAPRYRKIADRQFHIGEEYPLVILEARSRASHNHFFAALSEGFDNLPESYRAEHKWASADDMRQDLLMTAGFSSEKVFEAANETHAIRLATHFRDDTGFCRITFGLDERGKLTRVRVRRAKSQDHSSMDKQTFEASKKAVLDLLEGIIGLTRGDLMKHAGRSA